MRGRVRAICGEAMQTLRCHVALFLFIAMLAICSEALAEELHDAVRAQDVDAVDSLLNSGAEIDASDFILGTPLHIAASNGHQKIAELLIDRGADLEAVSEQQGSRALHLASQFGDAEMVALLLENGAQIEAHDDLQRTPLFRASMAGHFAAVRVLLDHGADVNAREDQYSLSPLHEAAHHGYFDVTKLLVERGAEVNALSDKGRTPFWMAAFPQSYTVVGDGSLLEYLIAQGADPNHRDDSGLSPLAYAEFQARQGAVIFIEIVEELRRLGATE